MGFDESVFASGLTLLTAMATAPDGRIFVAEKTGALRVVQNGTVLPTPFAALPVNPSASAGWSAWRWTPTRATPGPCASRPVT